MPETIPTLRGRLSLTPTDTAGQPTGEPIDLGPIEFPIVVSFSGKPTSVPIIRGQAAKPYDYPGERIIPNVDYGQSGIDR